ncbi:MAG: hypothetical protein AB1921_05885 [Thermodesulfobacteriota bacterium]
MADQLEMERLFAPVNKNGAPAKAPHHSIPSSALASTAKRIPQRFPDSA